jgi:alpha(1,3/1,4) fucosyltransferase
MNYHYYKYNENDNILTYIQNKYNENIKKQKEFLGTIIARHDRGGQRTKICNELSKYGNIKAPGTYRNNVRSIGPTQNDKINYISRGTYNICPENSAYEGYFTEKIFQAFEGGTIPLYWAIDLPEPGNYK